MIGHDYLPKWFITAQDKVASLLMFDVETYLHQGFDAFTAGDAREVAHTATSRASNRSTGTAMLSSSSARMYP